MDGAETILRFATVIGELAGAGALVSGFWLYRMGKRDSYVAEFKRAVATIRGRCHKLNALVNYELVGEIVRSVVFASELERPLRRVFSRFFAQTDSQQTPNKQTIETYMKEEFPAVTVAIHCPLVDSYESILLELDSELAKYQTDFPALYRVFLAVRTLLGNIENNIKRASRDDRIWESLIPELFEKEREQFPDIDTFRDRITTILMGFCQKMLKDKGQRDIDNALALLDIVIDAYLALPESTVLRWARIERSTPMLSLRATKKTTEDLREAEKALKTLLPQDDVLRFRELVTRLEGDPEQ